MRRFFTFILSMAAVLFACACEGHIGDADPEESLSGETAELTFSLTKGVTDNTTFSAYLFDSESVSSFSEGYSGTYYAAGADLLPGTVSGGVPTKDSSLGLHPLSSEYMLVVVSPAAALSQIGSTTRYGLPYSREMAEPLHISAPEKVRLNGIYLEKQYKYDVKNPLTERRSKIKVTIKCGDEIPSAALYSVTVDSLLQNTWFLPQTGEFHHSTDTDTFSTVDTDISPRTLVTGESVTSSGNIFAISQDYSAKDKFGNPVFTVPRLVVRLGDSGGIRVVVPLNDDFPVQTVLHYHITVNSAFAFVELSVLPWDEIPTSGDIDSQPHAGGYVTKQTWRPIIVTGQGVID